MRSGSAERSLRASRCNPGPMPALPNVLLLDLDDTILDDSGARDRCWQETCEEAARRNPGVDALRLRAELERVREEFWSDPDRHRAWRVRLADAYGEIVADSLAACGVDDRALGL